MASESINPLNLTVQPPVVGPSDPPLARFMTETKEPVGDDGKNPGTDTQGLKELVGELNESTQMARHHLSFNIDEGSGRTVVKVIDTETDQVIRQIPSEHVLAIAETIRERTKDEDIGTGSILDTEV